MQLPIIKIFLAIHSYELYGYCVYEYGHSIAGIYVLGIEMINPRADILKRIIKKNEIIELVHFSISYVFQLIGISHQTRYF